MPLMQRRVVIVAFASPQPLDVAGPADVLAAVNVGRPGAYAISVVSPGGAPVATDAGYAITPAAALEDVDGPIDTLIVAGGQGARTATRESVAQIGRASCRERVCSTV